MRKVFNKMVVHLTNENKSNDAYINHFIDICNSIKDEENIELVYGLPERNNQLSDYIFEGSQGLMLDQRYGFFPNVTRSNIGCKNIVDIYDMV